MRESYITEYMEIPERIHLPQDTEITGELVDVLVGIHEGYIDRYLTLQNYYKGKAKIQERVKDFHKSNNKLTLDYPSYIVDMLLGLFVGKPVTYTTNEDYKGALEDLQTILDFNDEQDENTELGKMAGINGVAYEIVYLDEEGRIRFNEIQPQNMLMVYDDRINPEPLFALYIRKNPSIESLTDDNAPRVVTVYTDDKETDYLEDGGEFKFIEERTNPFGMVSVIEFLNNDEGIGDFERVLSLIDEMNLLNSDNANDFEEFTNALLILYGMLNADDEDIQQLIEDGVLLLEGVDGNQGAEWLIKEINDIALKNYKEELDSYIHKFAKVPNMADESFASNISGEAMKFKLFGTDQIISQKERKFKSGLIRRLELIFKVYNVATASSMEHTDITVNFSDNKPINELDSVRMVKEMLDAGISRQFALSKLRDLDDVHEEIERQDEEKSPYYLELLRDGINEREIPETD